MIPSHRWSITDPSTSNIRLHLTTPRWLYSPSGRVELVRAEARAAGEPEAFVMLARVFGGSREFNPMAVVFELLLWPRRFRFYKAFRSFKHGRPEDVEKLRLEFRGD